MADQKVKEAFWQKEWLIYFSDETDRRNTLIKLTGKEKPFADKMEKVSAPMNAIFYKGFTDDEIILFESFLDRILENCKSEEQ